MLHLIPLGPEKAERYFIKDLINSTIISTKLILTNIITVIQTYLLLRHGTGDKEYETFDQIQLLLLLGKYEMVTSDDACSTQSANNFVYAFLFFSCLLLLTFSINI